MSIESPSSSAASGGSSASGMSGNSDPISDPTSGGGSDAGWAPWGSQRNFLTRAKDTLARVHKKLSWDRMAELAEIEPRALKTYRMPENSPDHRAMPRSVRRQIESLLEQVQGGSSAARLQGARSAQVVERSPMFANVAPALAALVVRTAADMTNQPMGVVVSGVDRRPGSRIGLTEEDRRTMAWVSRARLSLNLSDATSEIHNLLALCKLPLGDWLPLPEILDAGLAPVRLIDPEQLMPTLEAEELATDVGGLNSLVEERLFSDFREALAKLGPTQADAVYTTVREFVVRNPVARTRDLETALEDVPSALANRVRMGFYEPLSARLDGSEGVALCARCSNLTRQHPGDGWLCATAACVHSGASDARFATPQDGEHVRITRGLRQYWLEPGFDEVVLYDQLKAQGLNPRLYPHRDRVDIDLGLGEIGMDLKAYASPELVGRKLKQRPGGLAHYAHRWLVVPDWLANATPGYMDRLRGALAPSPIAAMTSSQALERAVQMKKDGGAKAGTAGNESGAARA